eukprot:188775-Chlamydomonas_euryale.AAC.1
MGWPNATNQKAKALRSRTANGKRKRKLFGGGNGNGLEHLRIQTLVHVWTHLCPSTQKHTSN